jgi:predicted transport protein
MSGFRLFRVLPGGVEELPASSVEVERSLQALVERHLEPLRGLRLLASDHPTGRSHGGRIDTLGLDENGCPVIVEYKQALNEYVVNQGLFYLDWLLDHRAEIQLLAIERLGKVAAEAAPRLVCLAGGFTRYDAYAIKQIARAIELVRYRRYGDDLLLLELVAASGTAAVDSRPLGSTLSLRSARNERKRGTKTVVYRLATAPQDLRDRYERLATFLRGLGEEVQVKTLASYVAFQRLTNFACVEVQPQMRRLTVYAKVDPDLIALEPGFTRNVRAVGHPGTGDLEIVVSSDDDLERAKPLLLRSYEAG